MKRTLAVLCSTALAVGMLSGCFSGADSKKKTQASAATANESTGEPETAGEFSYPMAEGETLTWWKELNSQVALEFTSMTDTPLAKGLMERTGVQIEFQHPPAGQAKEQFGLLLADGDLPDIIEYNWLVNYPGGPQKAINDGVVQPLNDIINQYCPNLKAYLEANPDIDKMIKTDEGQYYAFPFVRGEAETVLLGPMMRGDWLEELGLEVPTTVDEWYTVLKVFKEVKGAISPLSYIYTDARIGAVNPVAMAYLPSVDFYLADDGTIHYGSIEEGYRSYLKEFSKWYAEGLVDIDLVSLKKDQVAAKVTSGQAGASVGLTEGHMGAWITAGRKENPDFTLVGVPWPSLEKGQKAPGGHCENRFSGINGVAITTDCRDVERAARLLDYAYSEEGSLFVNFDTEGVTYEMVDGYPTFTDEILKNSHGWSMKTALNSNTMNGSGGAYIADSRVPEQTMELQEQLDARYEIWPNCDAGKHLLPPITPNSEESREYATIMNEVKTYRDEMTIKFIMGQESLDSFDEYVANIKKLGIDRALEIQTAALERYNAR